MLAAASLAAMPLAPLASPSRREEELRAVVRRMQERVEREGVAAPRVRELMTASYVLLGLEHEDAFIQRVFQGVLQMRESSTYQAILREGREERREEGRVIEARAMLLRLGEKRFGAPDAATRAALEARTDLSRLEYLALRLLEVESWAELLP